MALTLNLAADYAFDFQAAKKLYSQRKYAEAQQTFEELAKVAPTPGAKSETLAQAALAINAQKQYDKALEAAKAIPDQAVAARCQMEIMAQNNKHADLLNTFSGEKIENWPDRFAYKGFLMRAWAYYHVRKYQEALTDVRKAIPDIGGDAMARAEAYHLEGDIYSSLKEKDKAIESYKNAVAVTGVKTYGHYLQSVLKCAALLRETGKPEEALKILEPVQKTHPGLFQSSIYEAYGDSYLALGRKAEAKAEYQKAIDEKGAPSRIVDRVKKKMEEI